MITSNRNSVPLEKRSSSALLFGIIWSSGVGIIPLFLIIPMFFPWHLTFVAILLIVFMAVFEWMAFQGVWQSIVELRRRKRDGKT